MNTTRLLNSNQPAFPIHEEESDRIEQGVNIYTGVTKREYFAAMAMQGWLAGYPAYEPDPTHVAIEAVSLTDALIKALNESQS